MKDLKDTLRSLVPEPLLLLKQIFFPWRNFKLYMVFLIQPDLCIGFAKRFQLIWRITRISNRVLSPHTPYEIFQFVKTILSTPPERKGVFVEAGCFKGSSSAKFSLAASLANRELVLFDSFEGIPENDEPHDFSIFGGNVSFKGGDYCGDLEEVKKNIRAFGDISVCRFVKGFFDETMPSFNEPVCAAYLDVDLASSTRTCLKYLYPLLPQGGALYSQDGHLPLVIDVLNDDQFWSEELGVKKPEIRGLQKDKLVKILKQ